MKKLRFLFLAGVATLMVASSCSEERTVMGGLSDNSIRLHPHITGSSSSRAVETDLAKFGSFKVTAFQNGLANYMENVTYTKAVGEWSTDDGNFFWPNKGDLYFYAYAPDVPGASGSYEITSSSQKFTNFSPCDKAAEQKDFLYAYAKGSLKGNGADGMDITFKHALSEITVAAKNENTNYTIEVSGVKIGNIKNKGTFTFPSCDGDGNDASWITTEDKADYEITWSTPVTLGPERSSLDVSNVPFMLIPQKMQPKDKAIDGTYFALLIKAKNGNKIMYDDWAYIAIDKDWQMGKRYDFTFDFTSGAGQDKNGKEINLLFPTANCLILDPTGTNVGKIDVVNNINIFWSNPDVGDASNVLDKKSEWVAEVIWQDINSRAINFCNANGEIISGDTYEGKGNQPLYIKAVGGKKGNVVVGVKKRGAGDDAYLWSWHLWITEEPKLIGGFMDRNIGAMSATPSDGDKTYGLYYLFGRKDPFTGNINRYNINGKSIGKTTVTPGSVSFAKAMQTPEVFYTNGGGNYDWASPNNYTSKKWNDITDSDGKSLFDPSPEGWRLPSKEEYSNFSTIMSNHDYSNKGRTYKGNWFPATGRRNGFDWRGSIIYVGEWSTYWTCSPNNKNTVYSLWCDMSNLVLSGDFYRCDGYSVRCVQE